MFVACVRSKHFERAAKCRLLLDKCPSLHLSVLSTSLKGHRGSHRRRVPLQKMLQDHISDTSESAVDDAVLRDTSMQSDNSCIFVEQQLAAERHCIAALKLELEVKFGN